MINKMTPEEKSVVLARLCGWKPLGKEKAFTGGGVLAIIYDDKDEWIGTIDLDESTFDLYDEKNMALAWRVLNWAMSLSDVRLTRPVTGLQTESIEVEFDLHLAEWFTEMSPTGDGRSLTDLPPAEAQAAWLDKILELAYEAGMVNDEN